MSARSAPLRPRAPTLVVVVTLAIVAALLAHGAGELASLALLSAPQAPPPRAMRVATRDDDANRACEILARNIFDSSGPIACDPPLRPAAPVVVEGAETPACATSLRLVAVYLRRDAGPAVALIARDTQPSVVLGVGGALDDAVLTRIDAEAIELTREDTTCRLSLFAPRETSTALVTGLAPRGATPPLLEGVRIDRDHASIDRSAIERLVSSPPGTLRTVRARPAVGADGRPALRLTGIRGDHPLASLGLESGDLLRTVDGRGLGDPDAWLEALQIARTPGRHTVELERAGVTRTVTVEITDR